MKLAIQPLKMFGAVFSLGLISLSEYHNPGYGFLGEWIAIAGVSLCTLFLTFQHARGEAKRSIKGAHTVRVIYRAVYFFLVARLLYGWMTLDFWLLFAQQSFLFGIIFDPLRNKYAGDAFFYHGGEAWYDRAIRKHPVKFFAIEIAGLILTTLLL